MNDQTLQIKKFKMKEMDLNSKVLIIGKPATGKSTLVKDIMYRHRSRFPCGIVLSGTEESSGDFNGMVPDLFIYGHYNQDAVNKLVARQRRLTRKYGEGHESNNAFIVIDDCMDDTSWIKHPVTKGIFKNGRHWDLFFLLAMQYCLGIPPALRTCIDYVFIMREPNVESRRKIWKNYAGIFPTFNMFCEVLDNLTEDYHCMVIKNRSLSSRVEDNVFWYKAKLHKKFRVGTDSYWKFANSHYNEHYASEEELHELYGGKKELNTTRTKNGPKIRVKMEY